MKKHCYKDCLTSKKVKIQRSIKVSANPDYLTLDEAALLSGVLKGTLQRWIREERFTVKRLPSKVLRIPRMEFEEYMKEWKQKPRRGR